MWCQLIILLMPTWVTLWSSLDDTIQSLCHHCYPPHQHLPLLQQDHHQTVRKIGGNKPCHGRSLEWGNLGASKYHPILQSVMTRDDTFSVCDWSVVTDTVLSLAVNLLSPFSSLTLFDQFQWVDWPVVVPNSVQSFNFPKLKFDSLSSEHLDFCKFISSLDSFVPCHGQQFHRLHNNSSWRHS